MRNFGLWLLLTVALQGCASGTVIRDETGAVDCEAMKEKLQRDMVIYGVLGSKPMQDAIRENCMSDKEKAAFHSKSCDEGGAWRQGPDTEC